MQVSCRSEQTCRTSCSSTGRMLRHGGAPIWSGLTVKTGENCPNYRDFFFDWKIWPRTHPNLKILLKNPPPPPPSPALTVRSRGELGSPCRRPCGCARCGTCGRGRGRATRDPACAGARRPPRASPVAGPSAASAPPVFEFPLQTLFFFISDDLICLIIFILVYVPNAIRVGVLTRSRLIELYVLFVLHLPIAIIVNA